MKITGIQLSGDKFEISGISHLDITGCETTILHTNVPNTYFTYNNAKQRLQLIEVGSIKWRRKVVYTIDNIADIKIIKDEKV